MLTMLGIVALIALIVAGILVLRISNDPRESAAVRTFMAERQAESPASDDNSRSASPPDSSN
jgi:hypothetical protein